MEDFREVLLRFFEKVDRRYWYKLDRTYTLPGPDKVSSQIEHFLLAYHRPRGEPWARWQFDFEPGETSNVFECPVVVRGLSLGGRVSKQLFSIFFVLWSFRDDMHLLKQVVLLYRPFLKAGRSLKSSSTTS